MKVKGKLEAAQLDTTDLDATNLTAGSAYSNNLRVDQYSVFNTQVQGTHLMWNKGGSSGLTSIVNNRGLGAGGFSFEFANNTGVTSVPMVILNAVTFDQLGLGTTTPFADCKMQIQCPGLPPNYGLFITGFGAGAGWGQTFQLRDALDGGYIRFNSGAGVNIGGINATGAQTGVSYSTTSDYRLKENLTQVDVLQKVLNTPVYELNFKSDENKTKQISMIAHEIKENFNCVVSGEKDAINETGEIDPQQVDYSKLVPVLWRALQELHDEVEVLRAQLNGG